MTSSKKNESLTLTFHYAPFYIYGYHSIHLWCTTLHRKREPLLPDICYSYLMKEHLLIKRIGFLMMMTCSFKDVRTQKAFCVEEEIFMVYAWWWWQWQQNLKLKSKCCESKRKISQRRKWQIKRKTIKKSSEQLDAEVMNCSFMTWEAFMNKRSLSEQFAA